MINLWRDWLEERLRREGDKMDYEIVYNILMESVILMYAGATVCVTEKMIKGKKDAKKNKLEKGLEKENGI